MAKLSTTSVFGDLLVDGTIFGNVTGNLTGNASTATSATTANSAATLTTARNIALGGVLSGSASFNGSANVTINASIAKPPKSGDWWSGGMPIVGTDGVMEVGKYIDFHNTDTSSNDYDVRLQANTAGPILLTLPSSGGTLARTADNVASATKLQTVRTINGTNFDGTANITTANWGTARTITIGNTGKSVNGSGNVSWSTAEILGNQTVLGKDTDWNTANATGVYEASGFNESGATGANRPVGAYSWGGLLTLRHKNVTNQVYLSHGSNQMWIRGGWGGSFNTSWAQVYTTQFKPTYSDVGAAAASHGTHVTYSTSAPAANGTASAGSASNVSRGDHVHPLQTTVSGNAGSATKWATARTLTIGNTGKAVDGTANVSWSLSEIGAAASSHTHNYAGSGSAGGAANSAVKLSSARTINGTNFDGTANITTANWGTSRKINQISVNGSADVKLPLDYYTSNIGASNTKPYHHILTTGQCTGSYTDKSITIVITQHYNGGGLGIARATLRTNDAANGATASGELKWLVRLGFNEDQLCYNLRNTAKDAYMDVFFKCNGTYGSTTWYVLTEGARGSHSSSTWTKQNTHHDNGTHVYDETGMKAIRTYTSTLVAAVDAGFAERSNNAYYADDAGTAATLKTARTLTIGNTGKTFNGGGNVSWTLSEIGAAASSHNHTSLTGVTSIGFASEGSDNSSISTTINGSVTYFDFNLADDAGQDDMWRWRFSPSGGTVFNAMTLDATSTTAAKLTVAGDITATSFTEGGTALSSKYAAKSHGTHVGDAYATVAPKANGTAAIGTSTRIAREDHVHPLQTSVSGNAGTATTLQTARELKIGNTGKNFNGSANLSWTLSEIGAAAAADAAQAWNAVIKCATWSRLFLFDGTGTVGGSYLVNIRGTRANIVHNATFIANFSHSSKCNITQINNTSYSNFKVRAVVASGSGQGYFEMYDNANSATNATTQTINVTVTRVSGGVTLTKYTAFTDGTTIPSGYTAVSELTTVSGSYYSGKAATAANAEVLTTARNIQIGNKTVSFNGSANIGYTLAEIGALPTAGGTMTGNIKFADVTSTTYPAKSAMLTWNGSTDGADIYYQVDASDQGRLVLNTRDDANCIIAFAQGGTIKSTVDNSGNFSGKAATSGNADKLATPRTITVNGIVKGSTSFDGSANVTITTSANDITAINKSLTVGTDWMDTGITGSNLSTGTYAVQMFANCQGTGGLWTEYFSGIMSWYASGVNSTEADEIVLHKAGHAPNGQHIYLRTKRNTQGSLVLQIAAKTAITAAINFEFKFKKLI